MIPSAHTIEGHSRFCLLDANLVAGYYLPESLKSKTAAQKIKVIVDSVRRGAAPDVFLYMPNLCIAEVFSVFSRYRFAKWDTKVKRNLPGGLDKRRYDRLRERFHDAIHNGALIQQVELNRYHVLATDLISPVDAHYEFHRHRPGGKQYTKQMMSATDHLIIGMGIYLAKVHGRENFAILTADHRLANILQRARAVNPNTAKRIGLVSTAKALGMDYGPGIYPQVFHLAKATETELVGFFGRWPVRPTKARRLSDGDAALLSELRKESGIPRDQLPYSPAFLDICREAERTTGRPIHPRAAWLAIGRVEKRGAAPRTLGDRDQT